MSCRPDEVLSQALSQWIEGKHLDVAAATEVLQALVADSTPELKSATLVALRVKGESAAEIAGFIQGMLELSQEIPTEGAVDTCGTGGDGKHSFNISTAAALLVAAAGIKVTKHGNRSVSSSCGSADLLEKRGILFPANAQQALQQLQKTRFTFLMAPIFHPAMAVLAPIRKRLGIRTIFNLLGPLTNPARPEFQLIGAATPAIAQRLAEVAVHLGRKVRIVHGNGYDEATPIGPFHVWDVVDQRIVEREIDPLIYGIPRGKPEDLVGGNPFENSETLLRIFEGEPLPQRDAILLNAALVVESVEHCSPMQAKERVEQVLMSEAPLNLLIQLQEDFDVIGSR